MHSEFNSICSKIEQIFLLFESLEWLLCHLPLSSWSPNCSSQWDPSLVIMDHCFSDMLKVHSDLPKVTHSALEYKSPMHSWILQVLLHLLHISWKESCTWEFCVFHPSGHIFHILHIWWKENNALEFFYSVLQHQLEQYLDIFLLSLPGQE